MFSGLARLVLRHPIAVLGAAGFVVVCAIALLIHGGRLSSGSFGDLEADRADQWVSEVTGRPNDLTFVAIFTPARTDQSNDSVNAAMRDAANRLRGDHRVARVVTPEEAPPFLAARFANPGKHAFIMTVSLAGTASDALEAYGAVHDELASSDARVTCTGFVPYMHDLNATLEHDLVRAEAIALPLALLVLVLVFRTVVAAALPVAVGGLAVVTAVGIIFGVSHLTDIAMYSVNVCSLIGLGVSIDYSLFFVARYREGLADCLSPELALTKAMCTSGRMIAFSGLAVCVGLGGLLFFSGSYLVPMGLAGALVVALAVGFALTVLPAAISLLGPRINSLALLGSAQPKHRRTEGFWHRWGLGVMKHPFLSGVPTLAVLLALGAPFLHVHLAGADVRTLDPSVEARRGYELLRETVPDAARDRMVIAVKFPSSPALTTDRIDALYDLGARVAAIPHVKSVESLFTSDESLGKEELEAYLIHPPPNLAPAVELGEKMSVGERTVLLYATTDATPDSTEARDIVRAIRSSRAVADGTLTVGGDAAHDVDAAAFIRARMPAAAIFVIASSLLVLFLLLRSIVLPLEAVLANLLSMCGSFGALVWLFQDGHLGLAEPRPIEPTLPVLLFCILFGLSMDYEVMLLSRVKEAHEQGRDNQKSVAMGLEKTAGLITSAAAIMVAVFAAFAFARVIMIRSVGVGMALAVLLDATLVRTLLVPAVMRLGGNANWWRPKLWTRREAKAAG